MLMLMLYAAMVQFLLAARFPAIRWIRLMLVPRYPEEAIWISPMLSWTCGVLMNTTY